MPARQFTVLEFTTPNWVASEAQLLAADSDEVLDTTPVKGIPAEAAP